jgi:hypothetical protein
MAKWAETNAVNASRVDKTTDAGIGVTTGGRLPRAKSNGCKTGGLERDLLPVDFLRQIR